MPACAQEVLLKITPVAEFSTSKPLSEGDNVDFKVTGDTGEFKKGTIITGTVMEYEPNDFSVQEARVIVGNFTDGTRNIKGSLHLNGNSHAQVGEFAENAQLNWSLIRGGEINIEPGQELQFFAQYGGRPDKLPLRISPAQKISTTHNQIQIGDTIRFKTTDGRPVIGIVDYVAPNGWWFDSAQIDFKTFKIDGKTINNPLSINGFDILKQKSHRKAQFFNGAGVILRGKEIEILPEQDNVVFTIWIRN